MGTTMKRYLLGGASLFAATASAQYCPNPLNYQGSYYCSQVDAITYTSVGGSGSYDKITNMDPDSATCSSEPYGYSGSLSPLNEEVSLHIRGPLRLLQFAAYTPGEASTKKMVRRNVRDHGHMHRHAYFHQHGDKIRKRDVGDMVTVTIDGQVVSWVNAYNGTETSAMPDAGSADGLSPLAPSPTVSSDPVGASQSESAPEPDDSDPSTNATPGSWGRQGFYDSQQAVADGIVFLNHFGGTGSGVFDYSFGSSLSYASSDGCTGSSSPQVLADTTLPSSAEIVIMTNSECGGDNGGCGYYRAGNVAYHGFDGAEKAFFFEFEMPNDGQTGADAYDPVNMPSIWMLNAQIPRTLQYGQAECSCWTSGCGEFDIFEVLYPGYDKAKSTLHGNIAGGSSDWFQRPESGPIKVGLIMVNDNIHVKILDDDTDFGSSQAASVIQDIVDSTMVQSQSVSLFSLQGAGGG